MTFCGMGWYNGGRNKNGESILDLLRCKVHPKLLKMLPRALGRSSTTGSTTSGSAHRGSSTPERTLDQGIRNGPHTSSTLSTRNVIDIDSIPSVHSVPSSHNPPSIDSVPSTLTEPTSSWDSNSSASSVSSTPSEPSNTRQPRNLQPSSQDHITMDTFQEMMIRYKDETISLLANDLSGLVNAWNSQNVIRTVREEVCGDLRYLVTAVNDNLKHLLTEKAEFQACMLEQSEELEVLRRQKRELLRQNAEIKCENIELKRQKAELDQSAAVCKRGSAKTHDDTLDTSERSLLDDEDHEQEQLNTQASPTNTSTAATPRARKPSQLTPESPFIVSSLRRALYTIDSPSAHPPPHSSQISPSVYTSETMNLRGSLTPTPAYVRAQTSPLSVPESVLPMLGGLNEERLKDILARYAGHGITPEHISRDVREALGTFLEGDDERQQCQEKIDRAVGLFKDARVRLNEVWEALQAVGEFMKDRSQVGKSEVAAAGGRWDEMMNARGFL